MEIVGISGYAQAGKTSLLRYLENTHNYAVLSTVEYINMCLLAHYRLPLTPEYLLVLQTKQGDLVKEIEKVTGMPLRETKIHIAEEILVPRYGRFRGIVLPAVDFFKATCGKMQRDFNDTRVIIEVYNKTELALLNIALDQVFNASLETGFNVRRNTELATVDTRDLVFEDDFWNESSIELMGEFIHGSFNNYFQNKRSKVAC